VSGEESTIVWSSMETINDIKENKI